MGIMINFFKKTKGDFTMPAFNYPELEQKAARVLYNSNEFINKWVDFISAPAGNITLEYYDENGNLKTATFSNRNKLVQDFIANANSVMNKTFYVDAVNGDDNNDGSESAPFKTLQKAIDSVPVGGRVIIVLQSDYEVLDHNEMIYIYSKHVFINLNGYILKTNVDSSTSYNQLRLVFLNKASLLAFLLTGNSQIILDDTGYDSSKIWLYCNNRLVHCSGEGIFEYLGRSQLDILAKDMNAGVPFLVIKKGALIGYAGEYGEFTVDGFDVNIVAWQGESKAIIDDMLIKMHAPVNFHWHVDTVEDSNGNSVNIADKIAGIVKDANGVPRNIISNIVF